MSLVFMDGFDHYTIADMGRKWNVPGNGSMSTSVFRNGTQSYLNTSAQAPRFALSTADQHATLIVGCAFRLSILPSSPLALLTLYGDAFVTTHTTLGVTAAGKLQVFRGTTGGTLLGSESGTSIAVNTWYFLELKAVLHDSTGAITLRVDGSSVITLTSQDTKNAGTGSVYDGIGFTGNANANYIDDLYLCNGAGSAFNDLLGDVKVQTLYPSGAGNSTNLTPSTGSNYQAVDDATGNTSDYVSSSVATTKDTYAFDNLTAGYDPKGLQVIALAAKEAPGAVRTVIPVVRSGGTDYDGSARTLPFGWVYGRQVYEQDPATSTAWTTSGVNAAEFGVKVG